MNKIWDYLSGWKTILFYILAQAFGSYPLVLSSFQELLADSKNIEKIINFLVQLGIALGLSHKVLKNVGIAKKE